MAEPCVLELRFLCRRINSEFYLKDICLHLKKGQALALVGKNASGKSSLFAAVMGMLPAQEGEILLDGEPVVIDSPQQAVAHGLILVGQNQPMFPEMKVYENMFFGHEMLLHKGMKFTDNRGMLSRCEEVFAEMQVHIDPRIQYKELTNAQRQIVGIARAVISNARVILLDEPSTHLNEQEKRMLFQSIHALKAAGRSFLLISHDPGEVLALADEVAVMKGGKLELSVPAAEMDENALMQAAYGISIAEIYKRASAEISEQVLLQVEHLSGYGFSDVSFSAHAGEVVAVMGDSSAGRHHLASALSGLEKAQGTVLVDGKRLALGSAVSAAEIGVSLALSPAEEILIQNSRKVVAKGHRDGVGSRALFFLKQELTQASQLLAHFTSFKRADAVYMTGGNSQRELIERAMRRRAKVYMLCEISAGLDLPARMDIYYKLGQLAQTGVAILLLTGSPDEAFGLSDRILVLKNGKIALDAQTAQADRTQVCQMIQPA